MLGEIDKIRKQSINQLSTRTEFYKSANFNSSKSYQGFISFKSVLNNLTCRYNVIVPGLNNTTLTNVPVKSHSVMSNGVGFRPPALRPGQPVIIRFASDSNALPYIDGSLFIVGKEDQYKSEPPGVDDRHPDNNQAINPPPISPELLQVAGEASLEVHPMILRDFSPVHGSGSPAGIEVPGVSILKDCYGNYTEVIPGQKISVKTKSEIEEVLGADGSIVNEIAKRALEASTNSMRQAIESDPKFASIVRGVYTLGRIHPKSKDKSIASTGTQGTVSPEDQFALVDKYLNLIDSTLGSYIKQLSLIIQQIKHVLTTTFNYYTQLKAVWGQLGVVGTILSGKEFVPTNKIDELLGFNLEDLLKVLNELYLRLSTIVGLGLRLSSSPISIKTEGRLLFGGFSFSDKSRDLKYKAIHRIVNRRISGSYTQSPLYDLALYLNSLGIVRAGAVVQKTYDFTQDPNISNFLRVADEYVSPRYQFINTIARTIYNNPYLDPAGEPTTDFLQDLNDIQITDNPTSVGCPALPPQIYEILRTIRPGEFHQPQVNNFISEYLLVRKTFSFKEWIYDPEKAVEHYSDSTQKVLKHLLAGELSEYYLESIKLLSTVNLTEYSYKVEELNSYVARGHQLGLLISSFT